MFPIATSTCSTADATTTCVYEIVSGTSTPPFYVPSVSAGDIGIMFGIFILVVIALYKAIFQ